MINIGYNMYTMCTNVLSIYIYFFKEEKKSKKRILLGCLALLYSCYYCRCLNESWWVRWEKRKNEWMNGKTKAYEIVGELLEKKRKSINFECETDGMGMRRRRRTSEKSGFLPFSFEDEEDQKYHPVFFLSLSWFSLLPVCPFKAALQTKKRRYIINIIKALSVCLKKHHHYFHSRFSSCVAGVFGVEKPLSLSTLKSLLLLLLEQSFKSQRVYLSVCFFSLSPFFELNGRSFHNKLERTLLSVFFTRASLFGSHTAFPLAQFFFLEEKISPLLSPLHYYCHHDHQLFE